MSEPQAIPPKETTEEEKLAKKRAKNRARKQKAKEKKAELNKLNEEFEKEVLAQYKGKEMPEDLNALRSAVGKDSEGISLGETAKQHEFWKTQPVPAMNAVIPQGFNHPIEPDKKPEEIRKDPYPLPEGLRFVLINISDADQLKEVYTLLAGNYVEDDGAFFRFNYSIEFLKWALLPPGFERDWHIGIRSNTDQSLVGFISGIPATIHVYDRIVKTAEINFLCVHKSIRDSRMAPLLIKEVTRRVHLKGIFQAVYTAGRVLPNPVGSCTYYHRNLNPKKLVRIGFSSTKKLLTVPRMEKLYKVSDRLTIPNVVPFEKRHVKQVFELLKNYLAKFSIAPIFSVDEIEHWFLPKKNVVFSFVVEDHNKQAVDFMSYYHLSSTVLDDDVYKDLNAVYCFYYAPKEHTPKQLMEQAIILAKKDDQDVFNCLNLMDNQTFINDLLFGVGDGNLNYYIFNWACPSVDSKEMGLVLL